LAYNYSDAQEIVEICENNNIKLFVNFIRRSDPGAIEIKKMISNKSIQSPIKGVCWYSKGMYNNCSHFINLIEHWLGYFKKSFVISKGRLFNQIDPEPDFLLEFEKGSVSFFSAWEEFYSFYKIELITKTGTINYNSGGEKISFHNIEADKKINNFKIISNSGIQIGSDMNNYQYNVYNELYKSINGLHANICKGNEALETQKILYLIDKQLSK